MSQSFYNNNHRSNCFNFAKFCLENFDQEIEKRGTEAQKNIKQNETRFITKNKNKYLIHRSL